MISCSTIEGLMAASLYEPLDEGEHGVMDAHLAACPTCAAAYASLQTLVADIPNEAISFSGDLRPVLREQIRRQAVSRRRRLWACLSLSAALFVLVSIGFFLNDADLSVDVATNEAALDAQHPILLEVRALAEAGDYLAARNRLAAALEAPEDTTTAGLLKLEMAELEFIDLGRYEEAYQGYLSVLEGHADVWAKSSGAVKERYDLLTESRDVNYEPLDQIAIARNKGEAGIPALEKVMARYPGRTLAGAALTTMASLVEGEGVAAYEAVKARCTNPMALAQLDVRLGEGYWTEGRDPAQGRVLLETVAQGPLEVPAKMAKETLARLMAGKK